MSTLSSKEDGSPSRSAADKGDGLKSGGEAPRSKPSMRALARKSILKTRQERQTAAVASIRHPRIVLPADQIAAAAMAAMGTATATTTTAAPTPASCIIDLNSGDGSLAGDEAVLPQQRILDLSEETEPEDLDMKLLWLARSGDWQAVDELTSNKRQMAVLHALGSARLRNCLTEGCLFTALHFAARDSKAVIVERMLRLGFNPNARASDSLTPLHLAYMFMPTRGADCDATIRALLAAGADPLARGGARDQLPVHIVAGKASAAPLNALDHLLDICAEEVRLETDSEGNIPLLIAVQAGNVGAIQDLLCKLPREQLHFKRIINDDYAIHMAAKQKDIEILKIIIDSGCNLDLQNGKGQTALHLAAANEMEEFVRVLCQAGADPDVQDNENQSPIHLATARGFQKIVDILSEKFKASIMYRTKDGSTLMHLASSAYNAQAALSFIRKGIPIHMPNKEGAKCIHIASIRGHVEVVKAIVAKGENVDSRTKDGFTPLHLAVKFGKHELVEALLGLGANLQLKAARGGETALHLATLVADSEECVDLLIRSGADVDAVDTRCETPLHFSSRANNLPAVQLLLNDGAAIDKQNEDGENILHVCVREGNLELMRDVIIHHIINKRQVNQAKRLINQQNKRGESAVHYAAQLNPAPVVVAGAVAVEGVGGGVESGQAETPAHLLDSFAAKQPLSGTFNKKEAGAAALLSPSKAGAAAAAVVPAQSAGSQSPAPSPAPSLAAGVGVAATTRQPEADREIMRALLVNGGDVFLQCKDSLQTPLHYCCESGNTRILHEMLSHLDQQMARVACNKPAKSLWTPLFYACFNGHSEIIKMLINQTARIDVFDENGEAPLHVAVSRGQAQVVDILLEHNAFVNVRNKPGMTPLHIAASLGYNSMVLQLITEHGAILDAMTLIKQIPLHLAAENGQLHVCKTLLSLGSDLNAIDNMSQTPLHLAARKNHADVLRLFLNSKPALIALANKNGYTCAHIAAMNGSLEAIKELLRFNRDAVINSRIKKTNCTALHLASENGNAEIVKLLLQSGAKPSDENCLGETALHSAAKNGHVKVLHTIRNADWKLCSRRNGLTALHVASNCGQTEFVAEMLRGRVSGGIRSGRSAVEPKADFGLTPLHLACRNGHEGVVRMLLNSAGVQVDAASELSKTIPVHLAAQGGHLLVAGLLISRSTDGLTQADAHGRTALHFASAHGHRDMVGLLIGQGAPINYQDHRGWTPLHYAAKHGYLDVVRLLVESGADPAMTCDDAKAPICMAASAGHKPVLSYLLTKDHDPFELMQDKVFLIDLMACSKQHNNRPIQEFILVNDGNQAPIDIAVKLAKCYETLVEKDKDRARDLFVARDLCDQVATDLLTIVASTNNSTALLKSLDHNHVEFLDVLIELDRKDVVSQHSVQKYLSDVWTGSLNWSAWRIVLLFFAFLLFPPLWAAVSCPAGHRLATVPVVKFMSYLVSHVFFIIILTFTIINPWLPIYRWHNMLPPAHEWLLLLWFAGLLATTISNPPDKAGFGSIKLVNLVIGFTAILVHFTGALFLSTDSIPYILFARNQLLALVLLLSFVELLNFLTFHHLFGPWAVIIQDLMKDMMRFLVIMGIFLVGFSLHVSAIYVPVFEPLSELQPQVQVPLLASQRQPASQHNQFPASQLIGAGQQVTPTLGLEFQSPLFTFEMLFYSLFGLVEPDFMPPMHSSPAISKVIMKLVFGVYMMITVVVLINLLIAMMSNTYQRIEARSDIEWKFGRAKLIRNMIRTSPTPSPLILLMGIWIDAYRELKKRQAARQKVEKMAVAAFNCKASVSEATIKMAHIWMSRAPTVAARKELEEQRQSSRSNRTSTSTSSPMKDSFSAPQLPGARSFGAMDGGAGAKSSITGPASGGARGVKATRAASISNVPDAAFNGRQITEVVNWPTIVRKYWEDMGIVIKEDEEAVERADGNRQQQQPSSSVSKEQ